MGQRYCVVREAESYLGRCIHYRQTLKEKETRTSDNFIIFVYIPDSACKAYTRPGRLEISRRILHPLVASETLQDKVQGCSHNYLIFGGLH